MSQRFVALDRDGTIIKECQYLSDPDQVELLAGAADGLRALKRLGLGLVLVTNQSGVGRGYFSRARLADIHQRLIDLLAAEAITLDGLYFCPHTPADACHCRKPLTGMLQAAAQDFGFGLPQSFVIGDKACDIELGQNVGATTFLVTTGYGHEVALQEDVRPDYVVNGLPEAAEIIEQLIVPQPSPRH